MTAKLTQADLESSVVRTMERKPQTTPNIRIIVSGGVVQEIRNIPAGVKVELWDYDCEESDDGIELDSIGDPVLKSDWFGPAK